MEKKFLKKEKTLDNPDLSIVIPLYNDKDRLERCLNSIYKFTKKISFEIIIVDNASADGGPEMVEEKFPDIRIIRNKENRFFNGANNQGFKESKGRFCMTLNSDTELKDNCFELMYDYLVEHPETGLVSCQLYYPDGTKQINCWKHRGLRGVIAHSNMFKKFSRFYKGYYEKVYSSLRYLDVPDKEKYVDTIMGACMMGPTDLINEIGGFDDDILMGYTDDVLCIKVRKTGKKVAHLSDGYLIHYESKLAKKIPSLAKISDNDVLIYAKRYVGWYAWLALLPLKLVDVLLRRF